MKSKVIFLSFIIFSFSILYAHNRTNSVASEIDLSAAQITVLSPNGGEVLIPNSVYQVLWSSSEVENVKIECSTDSGTSWNTIIESISSIGSYYWSVPYMPSDFCKLKISDIQDTAVYDVSDNYFSISGLLMETEPNNTLAEADLIEIGDSLDGSIYPEGDIDFFKFNATTDDTLEISLSARNSSTLYGSLQVMDEYGNAWFQGYYYYWEILKLPFVVPYNGVWYIRFATSFADSFDNTGQGLFQRKVNSQKDISRRNRDKLKDKDNLLDQTGDYRIALREYSVSPPYIYSIYTFDTYYNSTRVEIDLFTYGQTTNILFEYGTTASYGDSIIIPPCPPGFGESFLTTQLTELQSNTFYYCRATAENGAGTFSYESTFQTPQKPDNWVVKSIDSLWNYYLGSISFSNENIGFVSSDYFILGTTNGGDTWTTSFNDLNYYILSVFCIDSSTTVAAGINVNTYQSTFLKTTNNGLSWTSMDINPYDWPSDIFFTDENNGFLVSSSGNILRTTNGGISWAMKFSGPGVNLSSICFSDKYNGWVIGYDNNNYNGVVLRTTNSGSTWEYLSTGVMQQLLDICFVDSVNGFLLDANGSILKTTDGGSNWNNYSTGAYLQRISFIDKNNGIAIGWNGVVILTTDAGETWNPEISGTYNYLFELSKAGANWVVLGECGTVLKSTYDIVAVLDETQVPNSFILNQNYPNPFNPSTKISYSIPLLSKVQIKVYDILGNEVETLVNEEKSVGSYDVIWNAKDLASGIYFYRINAGDFIQTKKMILLK